MQSIGYTWEYPEVSVGNVGGAPAGYSPVVLGMTTRQEGCSVLSPHSLRPSPELSVGDLENVAELEARLAPGFSAGGVRGKVKCASSTGISLMSSPELSVWDQEKAAELEVRLALRLSVGRVGDSVQCTSSTRLSLRSSPELSVGDVEEDAEVEARLAPGLSVGGVGGSVRCNSYPVVEGVRGFSHGIFLKPPLELSVGDVGKYIVACSYAGTSARPTPE